MGEGVVSEVVCPGRCANTAVTPFWPPPRDAGTTWMRKGKIDGEVFAIAAVKGADGNPWIWAATADGVVVFTDGEATFRPADAS